MIIRLLLVIFAICLANAAHAAVVWSTVAGACVPESATIQADSHRTANLAVQHAPGSVDRITLICPVAVFASPETNWILGLVGRDTTGTGTTAYVKATLFYTTFDGSTPFAVATVISNKSAATTPTLYQSRVFINEFDFGNHPYWVRLELDRTSTSEIVAAYSLFLVEAPPPSDIRLKHDIELLGRLDNGLGFYRFAYNGSDQRYVGAMAQEVEAVRPDAVMRGDDGYLRVFYGRLGLRMQTYEEWLAGGSVMPHPAMAARE